VNILGKFAFVIKIQQIFYNLQILEVMMMIQKDWKLIIFLHYGWKCFCLANPSDFVIFVSMICKNVMKFKRSWHLDKYSSSCTSTVQHMFRAVCNNRVSITHCGLATYATHILPYFLLTENIIWTKNLPVLYEDSHHKIDNSKCEF
jgi:hypothetical protein